MKIKRKTKHKQPRVSLKIYCYFEEAEDLDFY